MQVVTQSAFRFKFFDLTKCQTNVGMLKRLRTAETHIKHVLCCSNLCIFHQLHLVVKVVLLRNFGDSLAELWCRGGGAQDVRVHVRCHSYKFVVKGSWQGLAWSMEQLNNCRESVGSSEKEVRSIG